MNKGPTNSTEELVATAHVFHVCRRLVHPQMLAWEASSLHVPLETCKKRVEGHRDVFRAMLNVSQRILALGNKTVSDVSYFFISVTYEMFMSITTPAAMDACFATHATIVSSQMFTTFCNEDPYYIEAYAEYMKSENKNKPSSVFGIVEIHMTSNDDVGKNMYVLRDKEDISTMLPEDIERLARHMRPNISDEELTAGMRFVQTVRTISETHPEVAETFLRKHATVDGQRKISSDIAVLVRTCTACNRRGIKLDVCSGCREAWYCDTKCQHRDWPTHKVKCKK